MLSPDVPLCGKPRAQNAFARLYIGDYGDGRKFDIGGQIDLQQRHVALGVVGAGHQRGGQGVGLADNPHLELFRLIDHVVIGKHITAGGHAETRAHAGQQNAFLCALGEMFLCLLEFIPQRFVGGAAIEPLLALVDGLFVFLAGHEQLSCYHVQCGADVRIVELPLFRPVCRTHPPPWRPPLHCGAEPPA